VLCRVPPGMSGATIGTGLKVLEPWAESWPFVPGGRVRPVAPEGSAACVSTGVPTPCPADRPRAHQPTLVGAGDGLPRSNGVGWNATAASSHSPSRARKPTEPTAAFGAGEPPRPARCRGAPGASSTRPRLLSRGTARKGTRHTGRARRPLRSMRGHATHKDVGAERRAGTPGAMAASLLAVGQVCGPYTGQ
jgi:hypothetical protein